MSMDDIFTLFDSCSFPVFNQRSDAGTALPYAVLFVSEPDNTAADDIVYCVNASARLELYTNYKDYNAMAEVETTLNKAHVPFSHDTDYIDSQVCFMESYFFGIPTGKLPEPEPDDDPED